MRAARALPPLLLARTAAACAWTGAPQPSGRGEMAAATLPPACGGAADAAAPATQAERPEPEQAPWTVQQEHFMLLALEQAREALREREVPIGCVFVRDGAVVGAGRNNTNHTRNATRHAELEAVDRMIADAGGDAARVQFDRCELYVTIEPCIMCAGALSLLGVRRVWFGAGNDKFGGCGSILPVHATGCGSCGRGGAGAGVGDCAAAPHGGPFPARGGLFAREAVALLQDFYIAGNPAGAARRGGRGGGAGRRTGGLPRRAAAARAGRPRAPAPRCPAAPKPHRAVMEVPPWESSQQPQARDGPPAEERQRAAQ
ncbi:TAD2 [Scenedesmus sp. PABB004]|nr:TAD2 [Scenedesmus sp. PABB004]